MDLSIDQIYKILHEQLIEGKADPDGEGFDITAMSNTEQALHTCAEALRNAAFVHFLEGVVDRQDKLLKVYPAVITMARYGGVYEGGQFIAFNSRYVPAGAVDSDIECADFWSTHSRVCGVGQDPNDALADLMQKAAWEGFEEANKEMLRKNGADA